MPSWFVFSYALLAEWRISLTYSPFRLPWTELFILMFRGSFPFENAGSAHSLSSCLFVLVAEALLLCPLFDLKWPLALSYCSSFTSFCLIHKWFYHACPSTLRCYHMLLRYYNASPMLTIDRMHKPKLPTHFGEPCRQKCE